MFLSRSKLALLTATLLLETACTTLPPAAQSFDSFASYAESVFRHQNLLISRLMMLNENDGLAGNPDIEAAEQAMNNACQLLNEYAEKELEGKSSGFLFKREVQTSIEDCDLKVQSLETLLAEIEK